MPIFGGVACDFFTLDHWSVLRNGEADMNSLAFMLVSGDIEPVFALRHNIGTGSRRLATITKAHDNAVEELDGEPFGDFAKDIVLMPGDVDAYSIAFMRLTTPFAVRMPDAEQDEVEVIRPLYDVDKDDRSGIFASVMPVGASVTISSMQKENVLQSCKDTLDQMLSRMDSSGRKYTAILTSTCNARALILSANKSLEASMLKDRLKDRAGIEAMGAYVFGEFCPTREIEGGRMKNRFHNLSFAVCAF